jgi:hypothetical protein
MRKTMLILVTLLVAISLFFAACKSTPAPEPEPTPTPAPTPKLNISIKIEATASTWREGKEPYDIYGAIKQNLEETGFEVVPQESTSYDARMVVDYAERKGASYTGGGHGTDIKCNITLYDKTQDVIFEKEIYGTSPVITSNLNFYLNSLEIFNYQLYFRYLGEFIAVEFGTGDEVSVLIHALEDEDANFNTRVEAARALAETGDARAVEPLIETLKDENEFVREGVASALGQTGDARVVAPLIEALKDESEFVREQAAYALGHTGDARALAPLTEALKDEHERVRIAAERALEEIRSK